MLVRVTPPCQRVVVASAAEDLRAWASALRLEADRLRHLAVRLRALATTVRWRSAAGDAFRARLALRAVALRRSAELLQEAAGALEAHATAVEDVGRLGASGLASAVATFPSAAVTGTGRVGR